MSLRKAIPRGLLSGPFLFLSTNFSTLYVVPGDMEPVIPLYMPRRTLRRVTGKKFHGAINFQLEEYFISAMKRWIVIRGHHLTDSILDNMAINCERNLFSIFGP